MDNHQNIFTVSKLNQQVRMLLERNMGSIWLEGEISNFSTPISGHWYFTLKDSSAQVKCAMFRMRNQSVSFKPSNGNQVLVRARISLYEPRGDYQILIDSMQPKGDGLLQQQFAQLKARLSAEGLFADANKQPLPRHPKRIGIVTSKSAAALADILQILKRRDPSLSVVIYPTQVQGTLAAAMIADSITLANQRNECDVLIVGRGGGSLEDLWCFNEEIVARAIYTSAIPVISAVGHETDVSISDFVADIRASTPSAAAELVSQDRAYKEQQLDAAIVALERHIEKILSQHQAKLTAMHHALSLTHPRAKLIQQTQQLDELNRNLHHALLTLLQNKEQRLDAHRYRLKQASPSRHITTAENKLLLLSQTRDDAMGKLLSRKKHQLLLNMEKLHAVSPLATLSRGYSISLDGDGKVIKSVAGLEKNQQLESLVADGKIYSTILKVEKQKL